MTQAAVITAVRTRLRDNWNEAVARIREPNMNFAPGSTPWIEIRFPGALNDRADLGDPNGAMWEEAGVFICDVYVPANTGDELAAAIADTLAALFQGQDFDFVSCMGRLPGQSGQRQPDGFGGTWWGVSFGIAYRYQSIAG